MTDGPYRKPANTPPRTRYFVLIAFNKADGAVSVCTLFTEALDRLEALEKTFTSGKVTRSAAWYWEVISAADFEKTPS
jgi:hypothetical protein